MYMTEKQFLDAFAEEWEERLSTDRKTLWSLFQDNKSWTQYMVPYAGFLDSVCSRLGTIGTPLTYYEPIYWIDAAFVGGEDLFGTGLDYPSEVHTLIEHENGPNVQQEMWKLIHWRCPLKVLIFYDYADRQGTGGAVSPWASKKLELLFTMIKTAQDFFPEHEKTTYLFVIGQATPGNSVDWRWASNKSLQPMHFVHG